MQTLRQAISDIINDLKAYNLDDQFSYRFIGSKLKGNIENFLKQDSVDRNILKINELWKPINNIEMIDLPEQYTNGLYESVSTIKRSLLQIPQVYTSKYGNLIKIVNINNTLEYKQIKSFEYKDYKNREYASSKFKYYWIEDDYLYIPDSQVEEVKGFGLFKDSQEADKFNGKVDCCYKPLDSILLVPDYIIQIAKDQTVNVLASVNKRIVEDENPNLNSNIKQ